MFEEVLKRFQENNKDDPDYDLIVEALEKQVAMIPRLVGGLGSYHRECCPRCGSITSSSESPPYCKNCGQRLGSLEVELRNQNPVTDWGFVKLSMNY